MFPLSKGQTVPLSVLVLLSLCTAVFGMTPAEYLQSLDKPDFREGHTLPPLTRFGWTLPFDARVELAEHWGYALEFGGYAGDRAVDKALTDPTSDGAKCIALAAGNPDRYQLCVICTRDLPEDVAPATWTRNAGGELLNGKGESLGTAQREHGMKTVYSPAAPESVWREAGRLRAEPIRRIRQKCPIAIVLNGGEYAIGVLGFHKKAWQQDPAVLAAKGATPWYNFISASKAQSELLIAQAVRAVVPERQLYIYYPTTGGTHRNRTADWRNWMYGYQWMKPVSDLPSSEHYYRHFNSGWTGDNDMLTQALNARGFEIANGMPLCYDWLCAGWPRKDVKEPDGGFGDMRLYEGFLKCMYTAGMIGGNAGYYAYPKGGFGAEFPADDPPHWLVQMATFARVHALFSHLERFLRQGDLLSGPGRHIWSKDQPAYEFPTGDADARVLVRKLRTRDKWLVTAWAADGRDRKVAVDVPRLGRITVPARSDGGVYVGHIVDGNAVLHDPIGPRHPGGAAETR